MPGRSKYDSFVQFFLKRYKNVILKYVSDIIVPSRFDPEDVLQYIGAKILDRLKERDKSPDPIRSPVKYFRRNLKFYCAEYRRLMGYPVAFPTRPYEPGGPDERDAMERTYVYLSNYPDAVDLPAPPEQEPESGKYTILNAVLDSMGSLTSEILRMTIIQDLDRRVAAEVLGIPTIRLTAALKQGMRRIGELLKKRPLFAELLKNPPKPPESGTVYLAAPYTHPSQKVREERLNATYDATYYLVTKGFTVINPLAITAPVAERYCSDVTWQTWSGYSIDLLSRCDGIVVLPLSGWAASVGVYEELNYAVENSMPIGFVDPAEVKALVTPGSGLNDGSPQDAVGGRDPS